MEQKYLKRKPPLSLKGKADTPKNGGYRDPTLELQKFLGAR